jgi:excisionase family DNA binding protein
LTVIAELRPTGCDVQVVCSNREGIVMRTHIESLAYPPRGMSRDEAARYVGVGSTKFDEMVADGRMPRPKRVDGRVVWDRLRLDMAFSDLPEDEKVNPLDRMLDGASN